MDSTKESEANGQEGSEDFLFFIDDSLGLEEDEIMYLDLKCHNRCKVAPQLSRESSPPLLLTFPFTSGKTQDETSSVSSDGSQEEEEEDDDSVQLIEDWMILGGEEQEEDSSIQLNLSYWNSSDDDSEDEDMTDQNVKSTTDIWAVSDKDKYGAVQSVATRYFIPGRSSFCSICKKKGHFAKNCSFQKNRLTCVLCGTQGHIQRDCPDRPCSNCGFPSHGFSSCRAPPVWKQHCQRCGVTGHLSDACPDTWRQYHLTVKLEFPFRLKNVCSFRHKTHCAHCYNCSKRGHYGFECTKRRMISGTVPSLPYVCHYDTLENILQRGTRMYTIADKELGSAGSSDQGRLFEKTEDCDKKWKSRKKQEMRGRRKTWPERRRERREVKRLRREIQAKRGGGLVGKSWCNSEDEVCTMNPLKYNLHGCGQFKPPPEKKREVEKDGKKSKKSREAKRWKKRGGMKRGFLYPHADMDIGSENFLSPKQKVRYRRR